MDTIKTWVCNECGLSNFTQSVTEEDITQGLCSCVGCGCEEFTLK